MSESERAAIANTSDLFRGSNNLLYVPAFNAMKDFHQLYKNSTRIP